MDNRNENNQNNIFYKFLWSKKELVGETNFKARGNVLVFSSKDERATQIINRIQSQISTKIIEVKIARSYKKINERLFTISGILEDYYKIVDDIGYENISNIIHFSAINRRSVENLKELDKQLRFGVYSLFYLAKALLRNKKGNSIKISLVVEYANEVTGTEKTINPHNAALLGLAKVLEKECPTIKCHCIDMDYITSTENIVCELASEIDETLVAYRNGQRFIRSLYKVNIDCEEEKEFKTDCNGVYVITGGLGGIGIEVAKYLVSKGRVNIALVNRSQFPQRGEWNKILSDNKDLRICSNIMAIQQMEKSGSKIICIKADVSNYKDMELQLNELRKRYFNINGVFHIAGIARDCPITDKEENLFNMVIKPKIQGAWILDKLTIDDNLDFFVMFSSINSFYSKAFKTDYSAANSYLDSYANYRNKFRKNTLTINWTTWKQVGMAFNNGFNKKRNIFKVISNNDAIYAMDKILNKELSNIIIGELEQLEVENNNFRSGF